MSKSEFIHNSKERNDEWSEQQLLDGISSGEESAFRHLFDVYYQLLVSFAYRYLNDLDSARNVVQDVIVSLYDKRESIKIHTSLKAHLYQSVRNRALNVLKREKMQRDHHNRILEEEKDQSYYEDKLAVSELEARIADVVKELPGQCRRIFLMSRQEGLSNSDIASDLDISKRTVETQISKALKKIREDLLKYGYLPVLLFLFDFLFRNILK
ncbi:RNA polymerase sigma-70 factor [Marinilabilia rubra]|uniref:RNA polymerase sigma-70 factor n=1 Tax=Marinilabilia rubra TaxID=2162893 RepID=UPI001E632A83|nr:RNA polymerase sigma-70 factor [Marinilabilia rubra]